MTQKRMPPTKLQTQRNMLRKFWLRGGSLADGKLSSLRQPLDDGVPDLPGDELARARREVQLFPAVTQQPLRSQLCIVRTTNFIGYLPMSSFRDDETEYVQRENRLGCTRYLVFALAFEAAVVIAVGICWNLRHLLHRLAPF
jgi:hypothetical protein